MTEPIVFVSHFRVKEGSIEALKALAHGGYDRLDREKPRTLVFLSYIDEHRGVISFLHVFGDADSMDVHFEGADERSRAASEFMRARGMGDLRAPERGRSGGDAQGGGIGGRHADGRIRLRRRLHAHLLSVAAP